MAGSIIENKTGTIASYYDADSGSITETGNGNFDFYQEFAQVEHPVGKEVLFIKVTTPTGKVIIKEIRSKE